MDEGIIVIFFVDIVLSKVPIEIDIFKVGSHTANNGKTYAFSRKQLEEVVETYDPSVFRAPLIVSHNTGGVPDHRIAERELCYGIPKYLRLVGGTLKAGFEKIAPQMKEWVRAGMLHSISSSFYLPDSPNNPYPGKLSLRHIAVLGANPPAVKGLAPLEMCEFDVRSSEEGVCTFSMSQHYRQSFYLSCADLFQNVREFLIENESAEIADRVLPSEAIAALREYPDLTVMLREEIARLNMRCADLEMQLMEDDDDDDDDMSYGEKMDYKKKMTDSKMTAADVAEKMGITEEEVEAILSGEVTPTAKQKKKMDSLFLEVEMNERQQKLESEIELQKQALKIREEAIANRELELEREKVTSFVETLVNQGKILAVKKEDTVALLLNTSDTSGVSFSQGEKTPRQALMDILRDQPSWNYGEEVVTPLTQTAHNPIFSGNSNPTNFSAPSGYAVDSHGQETYRRSVAFCQANNLDMNNPLHWERALGETVNA